MRIISEKELKAALIERNGELVFEKLSNTIAGIIGCGGLGSNIAVSLTRLGIKKLLLIDFDKVVFSNLNRQHYFIDDIGKLKVDALEEILKKINPYIVIEKYVLKITSENFKSILKNCDLIFEAVDIKESKTEIIKAFLDAGFETKILLSASGMAGLNSPNEIKTMKYAKNIYISGDFTTDAEQTNIMLAPRVSLVANHQVLTGIRALFDYD